MIGPAGQVYFIGPLTIQFVEVFFLNANAPYALKHKLDNPDAGWIVMSKDKFSDLREGSLPRARDSIILVSDTASVRAVFMVIASNIGKR